MTGAEFVTQMDKLPPFIVTTGAGDEKIAVSMMMRGAQDYLVKDIHFLDNLSVEVKRLLMELAAKFELADVQGKLRESEERYHMLFNNMTEGFALHELVFDENGEPCDYRFLDANRAFEELTGMHHEDFIGRLKRDVLPDDDPFWFKTYCKVALTGEAVHLEHYSPPLRRHYQVYSYCPAKNQFAVIFSNITERKQAETALLAAHAGLEQRVVACTAELETSNLELKKAARAKDEFLVSMSHELCTPLTGILGLSEVMQMPDHDSLTEKQSNYLTHIHDSGQRLLELLNDILDLSRLDVRRSALNPAPCSLSQICQSSLQLVAVQAVAKNLQFSLSVTPDSILLKADSHRLKQILANLLSNAIKFTPQGGNFGIEVVGSQAEKQVRIIVWDTGIGIQAEDQARIFQPFVQLDARPARQYSGTGLGLVLVKRLAELHGGGIGVESTFGQGSRFTVLLPWNLDDSQ